MSNTGPFIVWLLIVVTMLVGIFWGAREFGGVGGALIGWGIALLGVAAIAGIVYLVRRRF